MAQVMRRLDCMLKIYVNEFRSLAAEDEDDSGEQAPPEAAPPPEGGESVEGDGWEFAAATKEVAKCF